MVDSGPNCKVEDHGTGAATLRDLAASTGYVAYAVSMALRHSPRIPEATRLTFHDAAEVMNYLTNRIAQSLVGRKSMIVGLVLTDIRNPILTEVAQRVVTLLAGAGVAAAPSLLRQINSHTVESRVATSQVKSEAGVAADPVLVSNHSLASGALVVPAKRHGCARRHGDHRL